MVAADDDDYFIKEVSNSLIGREGVTGNEWKIIDAYYFEPEKWPGLREFCKQQGWKKAYYNKVKKKALLKIAKRWNLV
jgi:hypothetical protein